MKVQRLGNGARIRTDGDPSAQWEDWPTVARIIAGCNIALADAIKEAKFGRCIKCGGYSQRPEETHDWNARDLLTCDRLVVRGGELDMCGGVLVPSKVEGTR